MTLICLNAVSLLLLLGGRSSGSVAEPLQRRVDLPDAAVLPAQVRPHGPPPGHLTPPLTACSVSAGRPDHTWLIRFNEVHRGRGVNDSPAACVCVCVCFVSN